MLELPYIIFAALTAVMSFALAFLFARRGVVVHLAMPMVLSVAVASSMLVFRALNAESVLGQLSFYGGAAAFVLVNTFWWLYCLRFTELNRFLRAPLLLFVLLEPAISLGLIATNKWHNLWQEAGLPGFWQRIDDLYVAVIFIACLFSLFKQLLTEHAGFRKPTVLLVSSVSLALVFNMAALLVLNRQEHALVFLMSMLMVGFSIYLGLRHKSELRPLARERVFEQLQDGLIVLDVYGKITDINQKAKDLLALQEDVVGIEFETLLEFLGLGDIKAFDKGLSQKFDFEDRVIELSMTLLEEETHRSSGVLLAVKDLTEQRLIQASLLENEDRYRRLYQQSHRRAAGVALLHDVRDALLTSKDKVSICRMVVDLTAQTYGYDLVSIYNFNKEHELHLEHQVGYKQVITKLSADEAVMGKVAQTGKAALLATPEGEQDSVQAFEGISSEVCAPIFFHEQVVAVLNIASVDIELSETDLKLGKALATYVEASFERIDLLETIEQEKKRYVDLVENADDIIYSISLKGFFQYVNPKLEQVSGYSKEELIGMHFLKLIHEDSQDEAAEFYMQQFSNKQATSTYKFPLVSKDGKKRWIEQNVRLIWIEDQISHMQASARDISERILALETLKQRGEELERSNRDLRQFAFIAAHDLQEPLRKLQAFSDRLVGKYADQLDEQGFMYLSRIQSSADRMQKLIQDIQMFSHVRVDEKHEVVDLNHTYSVARSSLKSLIVSTNARIELKPLPTVIGDADQLRLLFFHVLSNALKFRRDDVAPLITITTEVNAQGHLVLRFQDNGIGFDEFYLDRIFMVFQTLHARKDTEGNGIGLAICRKIVEGHAGQITAESTEGVGTCVVVRFPIDMLIADSCSLPYMQAELV